MPREDVPYPGGALCRLKCQINELWQAVRNKLHSINGVPGDGNGDVKILAGQNVQIVNDQLHNEITISATGGGSVEDVVKTVSGVAPDADGEVTITAGSNITITPDADTNSIEIEATVPTMDAVAPIYIDGDGKIALKDWVLYDSTDWSVFIDANNQVTEDLIILMDGQNINDDIYIPKGVNKNALPSNSSVYYNTNESLKISAYNQMNKIFTNSASVNMIYANLSAYPSGSGTLNESFNISMSQYSSYYMPKITDPSSTASGVRLFRRA